MKSIILSSGTFAFLFTILSCADHDTDVKKTLPVREIHYDFETGEKLGIKTITYADNGKPSLEYYEDLKSDRGDKEIKYEYDGDGNLTKKISKEPNISNIEYIEVFTYEKELKTSEFSFLDANPVGYKTLYFYSGTMIDSTEMYAYSGIDERYNHLFTTYYSFNDHNQVAMIFQKDGDGMTQYHYEGELLKEVCNLLPGDGGAVLEECIVNEYNIAGELINVYSKSVTGTKLQESYSYKNRTLDERKIYSYPAYDPQNTLDVKLIRFEY